MDEIEYKLNTLNSVLVVNAIEKLISSVKSKFKPAERQRFVLENEELKYLREKCCSKEAVVSLTACQGLLALVEGGVLEIGHTLSTVITLLPTAQIYTGLISTIASLLVLDLKSRLIPGQTYTCQWSLRSPQHPFITVLEKHGQTTDDVITQMHTLCTHPDYTVSSNSLELLRPVFLWLLARPQPPAMATAAWRVLLGVQHSAQPDLVLDCLCWQQSNTPSSVASALTSYSVVTGAAPQQQKEAAAALLARLATPLVLHGRDPRRCFTLLSQCWSAVSSPATAGVSLALLADTCTHSLAPAPHCLNIISSSDYPSISLRMFVAQSLQWLQMPSTLTANDLKVAAKILEIHQTNTKQDTRQYMPNLESNKVFLTLMNTDRKVSITFRLLKTWERIRDDPTKLKSWFDGIESVDSSVQLDLVTFLLGLLLEKRKEDYFEEVVLRALKLLVKLVDLKKDLAVQLMAVLMYKIANDESPKMKLECLRVLPLMAKTKENVPSIVATLNRLRASNTVPQSFLLLLFTSLTVVQPRCFPYLQEVLMETASGPHNVKWEVEAARAEAVRTVCEARGTLGLELVPIISSTLNRCTDAGGTPPTRSSLRALRALWAQRLVAAAGTWDALEPRLARESRVAVQETICELISHIGLHCATAAAARAAWRLLSEGTGAAAAAAAEALGSFAITSYGLKDVPEIYRKTVKLPPSFCKTPEDAARNPADVLDYIPGEIWPEVFKYSPQDALPSIRSLCSKLICAEIRGFRSGVYSGAAGGAGGEPSAMTYLPPHSVLRALAGCVRKRATAPSYECPDDVYLHMLQTLAMEYPKPLPPMDWCFLQELFHAGPSWRRPTLELAARQASTSGSARRFLENYLVGVEPGSIEESEILDIFEMLPALCRNLPPNSIRTPIEKCLTHSYNQIAHFKTTSVKSEEVDQLMFVRQLALVKVCLENDKIHDANRTLMEQIIESYFSTLGVDHVAWPAYVEVCSALTPALLERLTSPTSWWTVEGSQVRAAASVLARVEHRGARADLIDAAMAMPQEHQFVLECMHKAALSATDQSAARAWTLQLMARAQRAFVESDSDSAKLFLWDVFVLSAITTSGLWSLADDHRLASGRALRLSLFPAAIASLCERDGWRDAAPQVLECLCHTRDTIADAATALSCHRAILTMKTQPHVNSQFWAKAVHYRTRYD
ncbi:unnamed protein product [Plutella xylostella]|uniref:(diamondback moth) hypothetical protein n=1 Tax=Plutella xylostella TaxID=51655 RepID=A0A8S4FIB8_PLUXY|nr:unnamed protein product [Plutella xylostella]